MVTANRPVQIAALKGDPKVKQFHPNKCETREKRGLKGGVPPDVQVIQIQKREEEKTLNYGWGVVEKTT